MIYNCGKDKQPSFMLNTGRSLVIAHMGAVVLQRMREFYRRKVAAIILNKHSRLPTDVVLQVGASV
jgi:hypothetical protein